MDVMAMTVWGEARGEGKAGQIAVAWTIRNRVEKGGWWGRTIKQVCLMPWQFSCWNHNDPNREKMLALNAKELKPLKEICALVLAGAEEDKTEGATHYHAKTLDPPFWVKGDGFTLGNHIFYRL